MSMEDLLADLGVKDCLTESAIPPIAGCKLQKDWIKERNRYLKVLSNLLKEEDSSLYGIKRRLEYEQKSYNARHWISCIIEEKDCKCTLCGHIWENYGEKP